MPEPRPTQHLAHIIARSLHANAAPMWAALSGEETPKNDAEVDAAWERLPPGVRDSFIELGAALVIGVQARGLVTEDWEWGIQVKSIPGGPWGKVKTGKTVDSRYTRAEAIEDFRAAELMDLEHEVARLVRRGVTDWKQVYDYGDEG